MSSPLFSITPLGGVGQIGSNMTLLETKNEKIIVDAGILFPFEDFFGINYLIPDIKHLKKINHLIITHGHEDHIGAIIHFMDQFPETEIHAPLFATKLIERKIRLSQRPGKTINIYQQGDSIKTKDFIVDPIKVNHSIPDTFGLHFSLQNKISLFLVSDFKIDSKTPYENYFEFERLKKVSKGFARKILMADSTNVLSKTLQTPSEIDLKEPLFEIINKSKQHVFLTTFSSNIHRIQTILDIAKEVKRPVVAIGRSMKSYIETAKETGHLKETAKVHFEVSNLKSKQIIYLVSGCQADFKSALRRIINEDDKSVKPKKGDTLIFSSKSIPGHERRISQIINKAIEKGMEVFTDHNSTVHVSGHPGREDLLKLYSEYTPDMAIPIHGESYFLSEHIQFIKEKYPKMETHGLQNFWTLSFDHKLKAKLIENKSIEPLIIHGNQLVLPRPIISERRKLATQGLINLSLNSKHQFQLSTRGIPDINDKLLKEAENHCRELLPLYNSKDIARDDSSTRDEIRLGLRNFFQQVLGYKPIVIVHLLP